MSLNKIKILLNSNKILFRMMVLCKKLFQNKKANKKFKKLISDKIKNLLMFRRCKENQN